MEYNTTRNKLLMPEYGRNIQRMVDYVKTIEDPEQRQKNALAIIELMGVLNPHLKNVEDFRHKLWDHLFLISDFELSVSSPYPIPTRESLQKKPDPLTYPTKETKLKHLGRNLENIINRAIQETDEEKKKGFIQTIAYYMKLAYTNWHKEPVHDDMIRDELNVITNGALQIDANEGFSHKVKYSTHKKNISSATSGKGGTANRSNRNTGFQKGIKRNNPSGWKKQG